MKRLNILRYILAASCLAGLLSVAGHVAAHRGSVPVQCPTPPPAVTVFGERVVQTRVFTQANSLLPVSRLGAKYLRVRLKAEPSPNCRWYLTVRDNLYRVVQVMTADDFRDSGVRWTVRIPGNRAYLDLDGCADPNFPNIRYEEFIAMPDKSANTLYSSADPNTPRWFDLYSAETVTQKRIGDAVGLLLGSHGSDSWAGSGVMIAPDLFLTNWHNGKPGRGDFPDQDCWSAEVVQRTIVDLSWDTDGVSREYSVVEVLAKDKNLDFAVLRVRPITSLGDPRPATLKDAPASNGLPLAVIHHPLGLRKQITVANCTVTNSSYPSWFGNIPGTDFTHQCDTEGGSSGAPIFNSNGEVIGLHHRGYSAISQANCELDKQNKAVHINKILAHLRQKHPALVAKLKISS